MRIWSLHPKYLDTKGLVALWREALLARKVLGNETIGYKAHPQLTRFRESGFPLDAINFYLKIVFEEALKRKYHFSREKITMINKKVDLTVTRGQILFETRHLLSKLKSRDPEKFLLLQKISEAEPHPLFRITEGDVEDWEKINSDSFKLI